MIALLAWPLSLFPAVIGLWCHLILYRLFIKKSKTEQVFSSTSCSIKKKKRRKRERSSITTLTTWTGTNYSDCEQQGAGLEVYQKKLQQERILLREGWIESLCLVVLSCTILTTAAMKSLGSLGLGKVGSAMGWKEGREDLEVGAIPSFQDFPENKASLCGTQGQKLKMCPAKIYHLNKPEGGHEGGLLGKM